MDNRIINEDVDLFVDSFDLYESLRNKSFLITGITGLIGSLTAKCLIALNKKYSLDIKIYGIVRNKDKANSIFNNYDEITFYCIDLIRITELSIRVDYIIHYASPTSSQFFIKHPTDVYNIITNSTETILRYANIASVDSVVYASSVESYGSVDAKYGIIDETYQGYINPLNVRSSYSLGKRAAEFLSYAYYIQYSIPIKIARLTQTFGAGVSNDDNRIFAQLAKSAIYNKDIILHSSGKSSKSYCYTTDAISAILYILIKGKNGEAYNIANPDTYMSVREMAEFVKKNFAPNIRIKTLIDETKGYAPDTYLNISTAKLNMLGWYPKIDFKTMYQKLIYYYKECNL